MSTRNKLVRDKIPAAIANNGQKVVTRVLDDQEYRVELERKLQEEVAEYIEDKNKEELADILEVVYALGDLLGVSREELESLRAKKAEERGAFKDKIYLVSVED
jgi:predicted house-cleaning noncanonical NTP pyrophosphatase (MazG superfamily)